MIFIYILLANIALSLISLVSVLFLGLKVKKLQILVNYLVALSVGTMLGGAYFHLTLEGLEQMPASTFILVFLISFLIFFILEKLFSFIHCHNVNCKIHEFGYLNLLGDFFHNFTDGIAISVAFLSNINAGIATTFALSLHELPQEIGDFGVLIKAGFKTKSAILLNLLVSFSSLLGSICALIFVSLSSSLALVLMPISAASMVYIASADLIPVVYKQSTSRLSLVKYIFTAIVGVVISYSFKIIFE